MDSGTAAADGDGGATPPFSPAGDPARAPSDGELSRHSSPRDGVTSPVILLSESTPGSPMAATQSKLSFNKDPSDSDHMVAIGSNAALRAFGRVFRQEDTASKLTVPVRRYDDFWSYSRHGDYLQRTSTLLLHYNALQTVVGGVIVAVACAVLLPLDWSGNANVAAILVMLAGNIAALLLVSTCMVSRRCFLDFACIPQDDEQAKIRGILNLGHTLKCSDRMLCLWDGSYWTRLWCVFECAAYLKLKHNGEASKTLQVLPLPNGLLTFGTFSCISLLVTGIYTSRAFTDKGFAQVSLRSSLIAVASATISVASAVAALAPAGTAYLKVLMEQRAQFRDFSLKGANCFCCAVKHRHPETGARMMCDRVQIEASVVSWFGSIETFEDYVREILHSHVYASSFLPYRYCALGGLPWFFCAIGGAVWNLRSGEYAEAMFFLADGSCDAFISVPLFSRIVFYSFQIFQPKVHTRSSLCGATFRCALFCGLAQAAFTGIKALPELVVGPVPWLVASNICFLAITVAVYRNDL